jgi:hypothetical protein
MIEAPPIMSCPIRAAAPPAMSCGRPSKLWQVTAATRIAVTRLRNALYLNDDNRKPSS